MLRWSQSAAASTPTPSTDTSFRSTSSSRWMPALGLLVAPLAEVLVADDAVRVNEIERRPVVVREGAPDRVVVVGRDGVVDVPHPHRPPHPVDVVLERELRRVDSDDDQPVVAVCPRPRADVRLLAQPVDARPRPEVHEHDVAAELGGAEWLGVEPPGRAGERGHMHTFEQGHLSAAIGTSRGRLLRAAAAAPRRRSARPCRVGCRRRGWGTPARPSSAGPGRSRRRRC